LRERRRELPESSPLRAGPEEATTAWGANGTLHGFAHSASVKASITFPAMSFTAPRV